MASAETEIEAFDRLVTDLTRFVEPERAEVLGHAIRRYVKAINSDKYSKTARK